MWSINSISLILASASPRRSLLLKQIGLEFEIIHSQVDETQFNSIIPEEIVQELAKRKAEDVLILLEEKNGKNGNNEGLIIAADTIVVLDKQILGKPSNEQEAMKMLSLLNAKTHYVMTGLYVLDILSKQGCEAIEITEVTFRELNERDIKEYISTGEPLDKAGAYGIQGKGAILVKCIKGCYYNVVGLPIVRLLETIYTLENEIKKR